MIVQNFPFGRSSGKIGNTIASKVYANNVLRTKPLQVIQPNSVAQQDVKAKFTLAQKAARILLQFIKYGYRGYTSTMSAYAFAIGEIIRGNIILNSHVAEFNPEPLFVSKGNLESPVFNEATSGDPHVVSLVWSTTFTDPDAKATDIVRVIAYTDDGESIIASPTSALRSSAGEDFSFPGSLPTVYYNIVAFVYSAGNTNPSKMASDSIYVDKIQISTT